MDSSVLVWGCVSVDGPRIIRRITSRLDVSQYLSILEDIPPRNSGLPRDFVHDHNPVHRSKLVKQWANTQTNLNFLNWPPCSGDIMPMSDI